MSTWRRIGPASVSFDGRPPVVGELYVGQPSTDRCPHGDDTCPCQDEGDPCHYEGPSRGPWGMVEPMVCPNPTPELQEITGVLNACNRTAAHCHVEGCGWTWDGQPQRGPMCGIGRIRTEGDEQDSPPFYTERARRGLDSIRGTRWWPCGLLRMACSRTPPW